MSDGLLIWRHTLEREWQLTYDGSITTRPNFFTSLQRRRLRPLFIFSLFSFIYLLIYSPDMFVKSVFPVRTDGNRLGDLGTSVDLPLVKHHGALGGYISVSSPGPRPGQQPSLFWRILAQYLAQFFPSTKEYKRDMPKYLRLVVVGGSCVGKTAVIEQAVFGKHSPGQVNFIHCSQLFIDFQ